MCVYIITVCVYMSLFSNSLIICLFICLLVDYLFIHLLSFAYDKGPVSICTHLFKTICCVLIINVNIYLCVYSVIRWSFVCSLFIGWLFIYQIIVVCAHIVIWKLPVWHFSDHLKSLQKPINLFFSFSVCDWGCWNKLKNYNKRCDFLLITSTNSLYS